MAGYALTEIGIASLTVSTAAVSPTFPTVTLTNEGRTINKTVNHMLVRVIGQPVRWRADGTAPTATTGTFQAAGDTIQLMDPEFDYRDMTAKFQAIRDTTAAADATLEFAFFT